MEGIGELFIWMGSGDVELRTATPRVTSQMSQADAAYMRVTLDAVGALVAGRHLYDMTDGRYLDELGP